MEQVRKKDILIRYTLAGLLAGFLFPVSSLLLATILNETSFTVQGLMNLHRKYPVQYLFDLIPLAGLLCGYYFGIMHYSCRKRIRDMAESTESRSRKIFDFINKLINNEFDAEYELSGEENLMGHSLVNLRDNLRRNRKEEISRKKEDDQKNWVSEGIARFAEIMRIHASDMEEFSFNIISSLVKYLEANQGGFYLAEEDSETGMYFDMKACYAYDRKKFADNKVAVDEGLIGTCAMEKQSIYISDIPENYLSITSGMGNANPKHLLIVPLMIQEEVLGIIELASFHKIQQYQIRFVESIAESIAMTLSSLKSNIRTSELLKESRSQAEALAMQEDRMRRNMEELKKTQDEAARQAEKFISFTNSVNHTLIRAEYETDGTLIYANTKFLRKLGYFSNTEVEGKHITMFIDQKDQEWFNKIWERLASGGKHYEGYMKHMTKLGQDLWTMATYTCVRRDDGSVQKILFLAIDTTEQKKQSLDYEGQIEALNRLNIKAEFAPDGKFITCNELFEQTMKYSPAELKTMSVFDLFDKRDIEGFNEIWEAVAKGRAFQGQLKNITKYDDEKWFRSTYSAVNDMYGEVAKVIYIANEITNERLMEIETRKQTDQLKKQEEQLKLSGLEVKKKLDQTRMEMEARYSVIERENKWLLELFDSHDDLVVSTDAATKILFMNAAAEKFWDCKRTDMLKQPVSKLFPGKKTDYDAIIRSMLSPNDKRITGEHRKVRIRNSSSGWVSAEMVLAVTEIQDELSYTAFFTLKSGSGTS
jgi:PAS domain S-box-containing protein